MCVHTWTRVRGVGERRRDLIVSIFLEMAGGVEAVL